MNRAPVVSVVSIAYNQEQYIRQALESFVAQQTRFAVEIVVADDGSTDATPAIIREFDGKYPDKFKPILRTSNIGVQPNLVGALSAATGAYIALCEGDDYWTDSLKLQKQVDFLESHPDHAMCFHPVRVFVEGRPGTEFIFPDPGKRLSLTVTGLLERNYIQTNSVMYRRQTYQAIPEGIMPLDWYLHLFHAQFGRIGFIDEVMSAYRRHPGGIWWDTERDLHGTWKKYGLAHLALYEAMMDLYGNVPENKRIIADATAVMFDNLAEVDRQDGDQLLGQAIRRFPDGATLYIDGLFERLKAAGATEFKGVRWASKELLRALKRSLRSRLRR